MTQSFRTRRSSDLQGQIVSMLCLQRSRAVYPKKCTTRPHGGTLAHKRFGQTQGLGRPLVPPDGVTRSNIPLKLYGLMAHGLAGAAPKPPRKSDRQSGAAGKRVSIRVDTGGPRIIKKKN